MRTTRNEKQRYRTSKNARRKKILMRESELPPAKVVTALRQLYSRPIVQLENMNKKPERGTRYYNPNWYNFDDGKHRRRRWNDLDDIWKPNYDYDERDTDTPNTSNHSQQQYRYNCNNPYLYPYQYYQNGKQNSYIKRSTIFNYNGNVKQVKRLSPHKAIIPKEATATSTSAENPPSTTTNNNTVTTSSTEQNPSIDQVNVSNEGSNINNDKDFSKKRFNINKKLSYLENYSKPSSGKIETTNPLPETQTGVGENTQNAKNNTLLNMSAEKPSENKINKNGVKESPKTPANNVKVGNKSNCTLDAYIQNILPTTLNKKSKEDVGKVNPSEKPNTVLNTAEIVNNIFKNYKIPKEKNAGVSKTAASNTVGTVSHTTTIANSSGISEDKNAASSPRNYSQKNRLNIVTYQSILKRPKITHDTGSLKLNNNNNTGVLETVQKDVMNNNVYNNQLLQNCLKLHDLKTGPRKTTIILSKPTETAKAAETTRSVKENTTCEGNKVLDKAMSSEKKEDIKPPPAKITRRRNTVAQSSVTDAALKGDTAKNSDESASKLGNTLTTEATTKSRAKIRNRRQTFAYLPESVQEMSESKESSAALNSALNETVNTRSKVRKRRQTITDPIVSECNAKKADGSKDQDNSMDQCGKKDPTVSSDGICEKRRRIELELGLVDEVSTNEATESEDLPESDTNRIKTPIQKFDNYELHSGHRQQPPIRNDESSKQTNNDLNTKQIPLSSQSAILDPRLKSRKNLLKLKNKSDANDGSPNKSRSALTTEESLHFLFDEIYEIPEKRSSISSQPSIPWNLKKIVGNNYVISRQALGTIEPIEFETVSTLETETHTSLIQNADERTEECMLETATCTNTATAVNDQSKINQNPLNRFFLLNSQNLRSILEESRGPTPAPNVAEPVLNQHSANNSNAPPETKHDNSSQSVNNVNRSTIQPETSSLQSSVIPTQTEPKRTRTKSKARSKIVDHGGEPQPIITPITLTMTQISHDTFISDFYYHIYVYCDIQTLIAQKFKSLANVVVPSQMLLQELRDFDITFHNKLRRFGEVVRNYFQNRFIASFNCKYLFRCFCLVNYNRSGNCVPLPFLLRLFYGIAVEIRKLGKPKGFLEMFCKDIETVYKCNLPNTSTNFSTIVFSQNLQQMNQPQLYQVQNNEQHYQNSPSQCLQTNQSYVQYQKPPPPYIASTYHQSPILQPHSGFETQTLTQPQAFAQPPALSQPQVVSKFQTYSQPYTVSQARTVCQPPRQYERRAQQQNFGQFRQPQQKHLGTSEGNDVNKLTADQESIFQLQCSIYNSLIRNYEILFVQRTAATLNQLGTNELQSQNKTLSTSHLPNPNVLPDNDSAPNVTQPTVNYKIRLPLSQPLTATPSNNIEVDVGARTLQPKASPVGTLDDNLNSGQDIDVKNVLDHEEPIDVDEWFRLKMLSADVIDLDEFFLDDHNQVVKSEIENNDSTDSNAVDVIPRFGSVDSGLASSPNEIEHPDVLNGERLCICSNRAELVCLCGKAIYCSTICQRADWYTHKLECSRSRGLIS